MTSGPDVSQLSPRDAAVALRSFPRRLREAIARAEARGVDAAELAPFVDQAFTAISAAAPTFGVAQSGGSGLEGVEGLSTTLASAVERVDADEWARGDGLAALREAVKTASNAVRQAEDAAGAG